MRRALGLAAGAGMTDSVAPEFARFVASERAAKRIATVPRALKEGAVVQPITLTPARLRELARVAARRASGLFRDAKHAEVVWVRGDSELAVNIAEVGVQLSEGQVVLVLIVRSDQSGRAEIAVPFAVGGRDAPAGMYAATFRKPSGPALIVETWGDALVAFAWQCLLELVSGIAGAVGKDARGNVLVPVELMASKRALSIVPMARHRFSGSTSLGDKTVRSR